MNLADIRGIALLGGNIYGNVLYNGFEFDIAVEDQAKKPPVTLNHFNFFGSWTVKDSSFIIDDITKDEYGNECCFHIRIKCLCILAAVPIVQSIGLLLNLANRIIKLMLFAHLWKSSDNPYNFHARILEMGKDLLRIVVTPFLFIGLTFFALYGALVDPLNGRKGYATCERIAYAGGYRTDFTIDAKSSVQKRISLQTFLIAPCFQPGDPWHLFGDKTPLHL